MKKNIQIQLNKVTKQYSSSQNRPTFVGGFASSFKKESCTALSNINLSIHKGERVGIIGKNGSGKTTLLKIIAGITHPNKGSVHFKGRLVSLIDLEAGFHPDLSGLENIVISGLILGMSKQEINQKLTSIISFADIGTSIHAPHFSLSQGMKFRIGFSVAIHTDPDIILLDEVIQVADHSFMKKCLAKLNQLLKNKVTVVLVSHDFSLLKKVFDTVIVLDAGQLVSINSPQKAINKYLSLKVQP